MNASVRMVCGGCLRSVEISSGAAESASSRCPYCGGLVDSHSSQVQSPGEQGEASTVTSAPAVADMDQSIDWVKTWERGSLGCLGRFQLRERLGDGGFGHVYRAYDPRLDRDVAIKILKQTNPSERIMERFFREARAVARLDHSNIVSVHDAGFDNGRCWVAYQLVAGRPLWWYRDHHRMDPMTIAGIIISLADALDHSHHRGVVHRDLKPANVLIDDLGRPRLIDFGLARRVDFESDLTREGAIVGTPAYMSPEQAHGQSRQVDERSDVYSLGVIFHELLHGRRPDEPGEFPSSKLAGRIGESAIGAGTVLPPAREPAIPTALKKICARATAMAPDARHPTARALADELELWLHEQKSAGEHRGSPLVRPVTLAAAAVFLVALLATFMAWNNAPGPFLIKRRPQSLISPPQPASPAKQALAAPGKLVASSGSDRYHLRACTHAQTIKKDNLLEFDTAEQAVAKGYKPCSVCHPGLAGLSPPPPARTSAETEATSRPIPDKAHPTIRRRPG
jgi:serine/threonine protein kinase